jgi:hypothetical protein
MKHLRIFFSVVLSVSLLLLPVFLAESQADQGSGQPPVSADNPFSGSDATRVIDALNNAFGPGTVGQLQLQNSNGTDMTWQEYQQTAQNIENALENDQINFDEYQQQRQQLEERAGQSRHLRNSERHKWRDSHRPHDSNDIDNTLRDREDRVGNEENESEESSS